MTYLTKVALLSCLALTVLFSTAKGQTIDQPKTKVVLFEGTFVGGYVDHGAYLNFAGPGIKFTQKPVSLLISVLPGLRIKEDKVAAGATKNALLTPSLGFGLTAVFKHIALQLPFYYNSKTSVKNGEWNAGFGLGYKF